MRLGRLNVQGYIAGDCWQKIYSNTLSEATNSVTISNLNGNVDKEYKLIIRVVSGYNGAITFLLRLNNDSNNNYGYQSLAGEKTVIAASRNTSQSGISIANVGATNNLSFSETILYAKSGYIRTAIVKYGYKIASTTVTGLVVLGQSWNNTADNITSLVIYNSNANSLGIGTVIELYKRIDKS